MRIGELLEHAGVLAQYAGERLDRESPERIVELRVSRIPIADAPDGIIGQVAGRGVGRGWSGYVYRGYLGEVYVEADDWEWTEVRQTVRKPRDGREYTWSWCGGVIGTGWIREYFPTCRDCCDTSRTIRGRRVVYSSRHDPTWSHAECGLAHRGGTCDSQGVCTPWEDS